MTIAKIEGRDLPQSELPTDFSPCLLFITLIINLSCFLKIEDPDNQSQTFHSHFCK